MPIQTINLGNYANDGTGDDLRTAFQKVNANFALLGTGTNISNGVNLGSGVGVFAQRNITNLEFKTLTSLDSSVTITNTPNTVDLSTRASLSTDTNPSLSANLNLNGYYTYNGDTRTTVYGYDIPTIVNMLELLISTNQTSMDMGSFLSPSGSGTNGSTLDMGNFIPPFVSNNLNFGNFVN